jgi:hypothetical protein
MCRVSISAGRFKGDPVFGQQTCVELNRGVQHRFWEALTNYPPSASPLNQGEGASAQKLSSGNYSWKRSETKPLDDFAKKIK